MSTIACPASPAKAVPAPTRIRPRIGYLFDPVPRDLRADVRPGRLAPIDVLLVAELIRWAGPGAGSCWCSKATLAAAIGRCPRTVQAAIARLVRCGWIAHTRLGGPDPDDPRNRTGWRFRFHWIPGVGADLCAAGGEKPIAPPPEAKVAPPGEKPAAPKSGVLEPGGGKLDPPTAPRPEPGTGTGFLPPGGRPRKADLPPMTPERAALIDRWLASGVPELVEQARRHLATAGASPARTAARPIGGALARALPAPAADAGTIDLLSRVGPGCDRRDVDRAVWRLCREFDDGKSQGCYVARLNEIRLGWRPAGAAVYAYQQAVGPTIRNRGAAFVAALDRAPG